MKKQNFIRGLCLFLTLFNLSDIYAQKFDLAEMLRGWGRDKKQKVEDFTSTERYGYQWILTTDGKNGDASGKKHFLHIGTGPWPASTISLTSKSPIGNIDIIRINTLSTKAYTLSLSVDDEEIKCIQMKGDYSNLISSFNIHGKSGTVKFTIVPQQKKKAAVYVGFIELSTTLSDQQSLQEQQVKPDAVCSYQLQRTFASTHWSTICLPFDVNGETLKQAFDVNGETLKQELGENCKVRQFSKEVRDNVMIFEDVDAIQAGVPYLIKPASDVANPIFSNVTYVRNILPKTIEDAKGQFAFVGTLDPKELKTDGSEVYLKPDSKLYRPISGKNKMRGQRAYFSFKQPMPAAKPIPYTIDFAEMDVTGIASIHQAKQPSYRHIYNLQGMEVENDINLLPHGVYICDGKKIYVR